MHIGDHDPSGCSIFTVLDEDLNAFVDEMGSSVELKRIAVTEQ
ncbi:MAG: hypothetical protein V3V97_22390 [Hyphomicrobiaceae bacterium]